MFFQTARETILLLSNNIHEKNMQSRAKVTKKIKKFSLISFFWIVFHFLALYFEKISTALRQSKLRNVFMYKNA